jgi:hypothetical protein
MLKATQLLALLLQVSWAKLQCPGIQILLIYCLIQMPLEVIESFCSHQQAEAAIW